MEVFNQKMMFSLSLSLQTNVYAKAQYRKMGYFDGFIRKAVVVIPPHHELRKRTAMRNKEMGDPVPEDALNAMKGMGREREREREGEGGEEREPDERGGLEFVPCAGHQSQDMESWVFGVMGKNEQNFQSVEG